MHRLLLILAMAASAAAGTIQGIVLEQASGRPLARAFVRLDPIPKSGATEGMSFFARAGRSGHFVFPRVPAGMYVLTATRPGYFPASYGQRLPIGRGRPISVTAESDLFAELRLYHKGAITGRVYDENGVGTAGVPVIAYRARQPALPAGKALTDDRGVYRIHGLDPGKYWVRSGTHVLDDGAGWLPTFGPQARELREARFHRVTVDADTPDADIYPEPGRLFRISGEIQCEEDGPVTVTLSSEADRREIQTRCGPYRFDGVAPAYYEIHARQHNSPGAGFVELYLDRDNDSLNLQVLPTPHVRIEVRRDSPNSLLLVPLKITARRRSLYEVGPVQEIKTTATTLEPGHWEMHAEPPPGMYVISIENLFIRPRRHPNSPLVPPDSYSVFIAPRGITALRIVLSGTGGGIAGRVVHNGESVPGVPVFLWPVAEASYRSLGGPRTVTADAEGRFSFDALPPGDYRLLASFDVNEVDEEILDLSQARTVHATPSQTTDVNLSLWNAP